MIGIDEVGRGAIAGPLLVCAVRLNNIIDGLKDSKMLTKSKRRELAAKIEAVADIGFGWVGEAEIDDIGLSNALVLATAKALDEIKPNKDEEIIIDGSVNFAPVLNSKTIIKADQTISEVSAASIVAKVARDNLMCELSEKYPEYGFEKHVGYGTKDHIDQLKTNGYCNLHRKSFKLKKL